METDTNIDSDLTPLNIIEAAKVTTLNLLPETSKSMYQRAYNLFFLMEGRSKDKIVFRERLVTKVALVIGVMGECRRHEIHQMKITHFNELGSAVLVTIPGSKTKIVRNFTVTGKFYEIYKKYANLRPQNAKGLWFFINYQKGKCTIQKIGLNKFGAMGKDMAKYLKLPNYTGHCFRRYTATIVVEACFRLVLQILDSCKMYSLHNILF